MDNRIGNKPTLKWVDIDDLTVDTRYQRAADSQRSKSNIKSISENFDWSKFGAIVVSAPPLDGGKYKVIDGQHRTLAALDVEGISELPCVIIDAPEVENQAESFVAINKSRVNLTALAKYHAEVAAQDVDALDVSEALMLAGINVPRSPAEGGLTAPNECQAIAALKASYKKAGKTAFVYALTAIKEAYPSKKGMMRASFIKTICLFCKMHWEVIDRERLILIIRKTDPKELQRVARNYVDVQGGTVLNASIKAFLQNYNKGLTRGDKLKEVA